MSIIGNHENEEANNIINQIKETAFKLCTEQEIKLYIQNHQNALLEYRKSNSVCEICDKILRFLETHFTEYVNEKLAISDVGKSELYAQYIQNIHHVSLNQFLGLNRKSIELINTFLEPQMQKTYTLYQARYISQLWEDWHIEFSLNLGTLSDETLITFLISQNFNHSNFFRLIKAEILGELHQEDDPFIQEQVLVSFAKRYNGISIKLGNPFRPDYPHIKTTLDDWLKKEIHQCRIKQKKHDPNQQTLIPKEGHKIETSFSVAQTAYFYKLLHKSGIITNKVQMDVLHVLSEKFRSKKTENVSFDSLHNKYYNVEDRTKESIREILKDLLKQVDGI